MRIISKLEHKLYSLYGLLQPTYLRFFPGVPVILRRELSGCETLLDLGCGRHSFLLNSNILSSMKLSVGVELFEPYLIESKGEQIHSQYLQADVRRIEFKPRSFDAVVAIELLEHLTKEEGIELIAKMENWARKKVVITTPNEYLWQDAYDNNPYQMHKCGWSAEELRKLGFRVLGINGWRRLTGPLGLMRYQPAFLWTRISDLTQKVTYYYPNLAFQLLAVKQIPTPIEKRITSMAHRL